MEKRVFSIAYQTHGYAWIMWIRNMMKIESLSSTGCRENSTWNLEFRRLVEWAIILGELHSTTTYNTNIYSNICTKTEKPRLHVQVGVEAPADCEQNSVPESTVEKWAICGKWNCDPNITPLHTFLQQNHPFRSLCLTLKRYFFHCSWHSFSEAMIWASWQIANLTVSKFSHPSVTTSQGKLRMAQTPLQSGPKWSLSQMHSAPLAGRTEVLENETSRRPSVSTQIYDVHGIIWGFLIFPKKLDTPLSSSIISFERNPYFLSWMAREVKTIKIHCIV